MAPPSVFHWSVLLFTPADLFLFDHFEGKDLIGVQNLLKKHQALQAEIVGHEPRIKAVTQKGEAMVEEGICCLTFLTQAQSERGINAVIEAD